jgi:hypothetical protein
MSADNGIYILKTRTIGTDMIPTSEYRVAHAQAVENIYYDVATGRNLKHFIPQEGFRYFGRSPVFSSEGEALKHARKIEGEIEILEYGICSLDHAEQYFETFSEEEMREYDRELDRAIEAKRAKREQEIQRKIREATITLPPGSRFQPGAIYGHYIAEDGKRIHGTLGGLKEIIVEKTEEPITFRASDWHN